MSRFSPPAPLVPENPLIPFAEISEADPPDAELITEAQHGNRDALEKLVLRHQAWIYNIAVRMLFEPHDAEEVTQEAFSAPTDVPATQEKLMPRVEKARNQPMAYAPLAPPPAALYEDNVRQIVLVHPGNPL